MKLKVGRIVCKVLMVLVAVALFAGALAPTSMQKTIWLIMLGLIIVLALVCLFLLRCPYCGAQVQMYGMTYCPRCGKQIGKDHEGDRGEYILGPIARGETLGSEAEESEGEQAKEK